MNLNNTHPMGNYEVDKNSPDGFMKYGGLLCFLIARLKF
jgi:hypothetical protein